MWEHLLTPGRRISFHYTRDNKRHEGVIERRFVAGGTKNELITLAIQGKDALTYKSFMVQHVTFVIPF